MGFDKERREDSSLCVWCVCFENSSASLSHWLFVCLLILFNWQSKEFISRKRCDTHISPGFKYHVRLILQYCLQACFQFVLFYFALPGLPTLQLDKRERVKENETVTNQTSTHWLSPCRVTELNLVSVVCVCVCRTVCSGKLMPSDVSSHIHNMQ